jgi:hypothetical protein
MNQAQHLLRITGIGIKITRRLPHVEQELPTLPEHLSLPPVFSGGGRGATLSLLREEYTVNPFTSFHIIIPYQPTTILSIFAEG